MISGLKASSPVMTSYAALGAACGVVLFDAGFSLGEIFLMSLLVYAGAAQFLAASLVVLGASTASIILMVFFLNLRHLLMGVSLSGFLKKQSLGYLGLFSHTLTDESFGINYSRFRDGKWTPREALLISLFNYASWVSSTVAGGLIGSQFPIDTLIMSYALIAMFLCMMVMQFVSKAHVAAALVSGIATIILTIWLQHNIALVLGAVIASFAGYLLDENSPDLKGSE